MKKRRDWLAALALHNPLTPLLALLPAGMDEIFARLGIGSPEELAAFLQQHLPENRDAGS